MVRCGSCGAETSPGLVCAACGNPLGAPHAARSSLPTGAPWSVARVLAVALYVVAGFFALAGTAFAAVSPYPDPTLLVPFGVAGVLVAGGIGVQRGAPWGWGIGWGLVAGGVLFASWGLARGFSSGLIGLALWGGLAATLLRRDVRAHCRIGWPGRMRTLE